MWIPLHKLPTSVLLIMVFFKLVLHLSLCEILSFEIYLKFYIFHKEFP